MGKGKVERLNYLQIIGYIFFGLLVILIVAGISNRLLNKTTKTKDFIAKSINETGKQRMLIRQIALLSSQYVYGDKDLEKK